MFDSWDPVCVSTLVEGRRSRAAYHLCGDRVGLFWRSLSQVRPWPHLYEPNTSRRSCFY